MTTTRFASWVSQATVAETWGSGSAWKRVGDTLNSLGVLQIVHQITHVLRLRLARGFQVRNSAHVLTPQPDAIRATSPHAAAPRPSCWCPCSAVLYLRALQYTANHTVRAIDRNTTVGHTRYARVRHLAHAAVVCKQWPTPHRPASIASSSKSSKAPARDSHHSRRRV